MEGGSNEQDRVEEDEEDFFNVAIQRSGCASEHYALQDCFSERGDWRKCGEEMTQFKTCMNKQSKTKLSKPSELKKS